METEEIAQEQSFEATVVLGEQQTAPRIELSLEGAERKRTRVCESLILSHVNSPSSRCRLSWR